MDIHSQANVQQIRKRTTITKYQVFSLLSLINFQIEEEKMIEKYFLIHVTDRQCLWGRLNLIAFPGELEKTKN